MTQQCSYGGCGKPATHGLEIRVWAKGHPKLATNFATLFMPVPFCLGHALEVKPKEFFVDESWLRIESGFMAVDRAAPDRDSAEIHPTPLAGVTTMMTTAAQRADTVVLDSPEKMN